jgi:hypothetical protein
MILGISGRARAGKDTLAELFIKEYGFKKVSFADSLKEICSLAFNIKLTDFYDDTIKDKKWEASVDLTEDIANALLSLIEERGISINKEQRCVFIEEATKLSFTSPRDLLQRVGTDLCRKTIDDQIWINIFINKISKAEGFYISADVRFKNEREAIAKLGGKNLLILRPDLPEITLNSHESEILGCDPYMIDVTIINDSTINILKDEVRNWWHDKRRSLNIK